MKEIVAELDYQGIEDEPNWSIRATYWVPRQAPNQRPNVVVHLFHLCAKEPQHCGLTNRQEFKDGAIPEYACDRCGEEAPALAVEEKLLATSEYEGYDPRNNRRAAVLATKNKRKN